MEFVRASVTQVRDDLEAILVQVAQLVLQLLTVVILARVMGPGGYGIYTFALTLVLFAQVPAQSGAGNLVLRYTPQYVIQAEWGRLKGLWRRTLGWVWLYGVACALVALAVYAPDRASPYRPAVMAALPLLVLLPLSSLLGAELRGLHYFLRGQLTEFVIRPMSLLFIIAAVLWFGLDGTSPVSMLLLQVVAALAAVLSGWVWLERLRPAESRHAKSRYEQLAWLRALLPLTFAGGLTLIGSQADVLMLSWLARPEDVGVYRVAVQGASLVSFILTAVNVVLAPRIARLHASGERAALQAVVTRSARLVLLGALPVALVLWSSGDWLLRGVFGPAFAGAYVPLAILCAGQIVNAASGSVGYILNMTGHERDTLMGIGLAGAINVGLDLVLIPREGGIGAATASAIGMAAWNLLLAWRVHRRTGMDSTALGLFSRASPA